VQDAGSTMDEIVASVQRVTDIIGEISAAALEQSQGIGQVNEAVTRLDQMTQQNAALVEESAAAAESLKDQAQRMTTVVAGYRLDDAGFAAVPAHQAVAAKVIAKAAAPVAKPAARKPLAAAKRAVPKAVPAPVAATTSATSAAPAAIPAAASGASDDWESF
jgi:uncharacterized phage infection (PIP) family protein YhgE